MVQRNTSLITGRVMELTIPRGCDDQLSPYTLSSTSCSASWPGKRHVRPLPLTSHHASGPPRHRTVIVTGSLSSRLLKRGGPPSGGCVLGASGGRCTLASSQRTLVDGEHLYGPSSPMVMTLPPSLCSVGVGQARALDGVRTTSGVGPGAGAASRELGRSGGR
jgi:hypothetical protein